MTDTTLKEDVREFTGLDPITISADELQTVLERAKKHIRSRKDLDNSFDFYSEVQREDALFWWTCLFAKVSVGQLDGQPLNIAAIDLDTLLASEEGEVTQWYRNAKAALRSLTPPNSEAAGGMAITSPVRADRSYDPDSYDDQGSSDTVDAEDLG
jgi:hypothetical protein